MTCYKGAKVAHNATIDTLEMFARVISAASLDKVVDTLLIAIVIIDIMSSLYQMN